MAFFLVWTVCQIDDKRHPQCALKDVWVPSDAKTEFQIQQEIFRSIEENSPGINVKYREHFMEISQCEVVRTSRARNDDMPVFVRQQLAIKEYVLLRRSETGKRSRIMSGSNVAVPTGGSYANANVISGLQRLYKGRKHVRVVFADVGTPLSEVRNHNTLFKALVSALKGEIPRCRQSSLLTQSQVLSTCLLDITFTGTFPLAMFFCVVKWRRYLTLSTLRSFYLKGLKTIQKRYVWNVCVLGFEFTAVQRALRFTWL